MLDIAKVKETMYKIQVIHIHLDPEDFEMFVQALFDTKTIPEFLEIVEEKYQWAIH